MFYSSGFIYLFFALGGRKQAILLYIKTFFFIYLSLPGKIVYYVSSYLVRDGLCPCPLFLFFLAIYRTEAYELYNMFRLPQILLSELSNDMQYYFCFSLFSSSFPITPNEGFPAWNKVIPSHVESTRLLPVNEPSTDVAEGSFRMLFMIAWMHWVLCQLSHGFFWRPRARCCPSLSVPHWTGEIIFFTQAREIRIVVWLLKPNLAFETYGGEKVEKKWFSYSIPEAEAYEQMGSVEWIRNGRGRYSLRKCQSQLLGLIYAMGRISNWDRVESEVFVLKH